MTFTIHASKNGQSSETQRIRPLVAVAKARNLAAAGWTVYVTDNSGRQFSFSEPLGLLIQAKTRSERIKIRSSS